MASTRTICVRTAQLKWYTGLIKYLKFDHEKIVQMYDEVVKPGLQGKITKHSDIRITICKVIEEAILSKKVETMNSWVNLVMALRLTEINETEFEENSDAFKVTMIIPSSQYKEKVTFWNIAWHMNHHRKQLYQCCFVQVRGCYLDVHGSVALSYTTGEVHDKKNYFLDAWYEKDKHPNKFIRNMRNNNKNWE